MQYREHDLTDWDRKKSLQQIELLRETHKQNLLSKVMQETMAHQCQLEVTPG